jgi:hypothetical protein
MRRLRLLLLVAAAGLVTLPAHAATLDAVGWWWRAQTGLLVDVPPPPNAPEGGLVVSAGPDGATAVAALRFGLGPDDQPVTLNLEVADSIGTPTVLACPATLRWRPVEAGRWDARPTVDCEQAQASGDPSEDGATWTFDVTGFATGSVLDVVLLPDVVEGEVRPSAFEISYAPPDEGALTLAPPPADPGPGPGPGEEDFRPEPTAFAPPPPPPPGGFVAPPPASPTEAPTPGPPVVAEPEPTDQPTDELVAVPDPTEATSVRDAGDAAMAAGALLVVTAAFLWSHRRQVTPQTTERGLSRWRTPRQGTPPPLI